MLDARHLIAYSLIVVLAVALVAVAVRVRYYSPQAVEKRRRAQERDRRQNKL